MNSVFVVIVFLVLFAIVLLAISVGYRFLESQRKKQVEAMLDVASGRVAGETHTSILLDGSNEDVIGQLLRNSAAMKRLSSFIQQSGLSWTVSHLVALTVICAVAGAILGFIFRPIGFVTLSALIAALLFGSLPGFYLRFKRSKRMREFEQQLPEALDFLARSMRAGHAFSISLEMLGAESPDPLGMEFRTLFNELNLGAPLDVALTNFSARVPLLDIRLLVSSVLLQKQTGGNLGEILLRLAFLIRERFRLKGQVRAASAHGRMTAVVLAVLPLVLVVALMIIAPTYLPLLANDPDGKYIILGAIVAQILGFLIMRRITDIKV
jgi:tight adherence protein B